MPEDPKYEIPENPVYNDQIRKIQDKDPVSASIIVNPVIQQLLECITALKSVLDNLSSDAEGLTYAGKMLSDTLDDLVAHLADPLPHIYLDGDGNTYRYGLAVIDGVPNLVREKIEEPEEPEP